MSVHQSICLLLKDQSQSTSDGVAVPLAVTPTSLRPKEQERGGLIVHVLDRAGKSPTELVRSKSHVHAAEAVYDALKRVCRLPSVFGANLTLQIDSSQAAQIEGASGGLSIALALAQWVICSQTDANGKERVISRGYLYSAPGFGAVAATGTIDREGHVGSVKHVEAKVRGYLHALNATAAEPRPFIVFYPRADQTQVTATLLESVSVAGGRLVAVDTLEEALETLQVAITAREPIGLKAYTRQDRSQFMGRNEAQADIRQALQALWQAHLGDASENRPPMLYWLQGKSGSGKSSLMQAGVMPYFELTATLSAFPGVSQFYFPDLPLRPALAEGNLLSYLARSLCALTPLAALNPETLTQQLRDAPTQAGETIQKALGSDPNRHPVIVLFIDQWEEVFQEQVEPIERNAFHRALQALAGSEDSRVWFIGAYRTDFLEEMNAAGWGAYLSQIPRHAYWIRSPTHPELLEIVRGGSDEQAALYRFEDGDTASQLARDAQQLEGNLAALSLALSKLQQMAKADNRSAITHADYLSLGGLGKVIANHANEAFYQKLTPRQKRGFDSLMRHFIGIVPQTHRAFAKTVAYSRLPANAISKDLLQRLVACHLLIIIEGEAHSQLRLTSKKERETSQDALRLAHEALLEHWDVLANWAEREKNRQRRIRSMLMIGATIFFASTSMVIYSLYLEMSSQKNKAEELALNEQKMRRVAEERSKNLTGTVMLYKELLEEKMDPTSLLPISEYRLVAKIEGSELMQCHYQEGCILNQLDAISSLSRKYVQILREAFPPHSQPEEACEEGPFYILTRTDNECEYARYEIGNLHSIDVYEATYKNRTTLAYLVHSSYWGSPNNGPALPVAFLSRSDKNQVFELLLTNDYVGVTEAENNNDGDILNVKLRWLKEKDAPDILIGRRFGYAASSKSFEYEFYRYDPEQHIHIRYCIAQGQFDNTKQHWQRDLVNNIATSGCE